MTDLAARYIASVQWHAVGVSVVVGLMASTAYVLYAMAFRTSGAPTLTVGYLFHLGLNPWMIAGVLCGFGAIVVRMWLFSALGPQRSYFAMSTAYVINSLLLLSIFREPMTSTQWLGVFVIGLGTVLIAQE